MEGPLHGLVLLILLLSCLIICWVRGNPRWLVLPYFVLVFVAAKIVFGLLTFLAVGFLDFRSLVLSYHSQQSQQYVDGWESAIDIATYQLPLFLACVITCYRFVVVRLAPRLLLAVVALMLCVLAGWHVYRLISFNTYVTSMKADIRELYSENVHYSLVWYTAISGIEEVSDAYDPRRQVALQGQALIKQPPVYLYNTSEIGTPRPDWYPTHPPAWIQGVKSNANLNGIGLLCLLGLSCLLIVIRIILWWQRRIRRTIRELLWQLLYIAALFALPWLLFGDPRESNYSQVLITSITLGAVGWTLPYLHRAHATMMITVFLLGFLLSGQALMLHNEEFGPEIYSYSYHSQAGDEKEHPPVNAWHSWLTGLQYEK